MLKVDFHTHTADDPVDRIPHTTRDLIDRAARLGFDALAITLHERQLDVRPFAAYAAERGIVLVPGVERTVEGRHVLLLNFARGAGAEHVRTFDDLRRFKARHRGAPGLVVAPHPFFPTSSCLRAQLDRHADLFDAVEVNAMFTRAIDFNRKAERWAAAHGRPTVGNGDVHRLRQLGTTYSVVDAPPAADAICAAVAAGRVHVARRALSLVDAAAIMASLGAAGLLPRRSDRAADASPAPARANQPAA
jgi:predicted metal-dependent phosphoesterase TrpH